MPLRDKEPTLRRHFFFVAGYDPMDADGHHRIFTREMARFASVWQVETDCEARARRTATGALWDASARGDGWTTQTRFEILAWEDLVRADMRRSRWSHIVGGVRAFADMVVTGTILRYFSFSHRYGIFFILTYVALIAVMAAAGVAAWLAFGFAEALGPEAAFIATVAAASIVFLGLMTTFGARFRLMQSLNLAEFSVDFVRGRHPDIDTRMDAFADRVLAVAAEGGVDEIVIAGHSLGAMHAMTLLSRAVEKNPDFAKTITVNLCTVGSTSAKFALHPAGERLRQSAQAVHDAFSIGWVEFQARDDIVSFYKVDPVTLTYANNADGRRRPFVRQVTIREMLTPETFARFRLDIMRLHCQFFLANDRRAAYDFYAFVFAPVPFAALVANIDGPLAVFGEDGALLTAPCRGAA